MFTKEQIQLAFDEVKSGADFTQFVQDLKSICVIYYETFVVDGSSSYFGENKYVLRFEAKYPLLNINKKCSSDKLKQAILVHQKGKTDYTIFCLQVAESGVEKWITHMLEMTVTYLDSSGNKIRVEQIPNL